MKEIVILDAATLGGDVKLESLEKLGKLSIFQKTAAGETSLRVKNAEIIITNKVVIGREILDGAPGVKLICVAATGANNIDMDCCREKNVAVANVAGYSTNSVVQHTFAMLLHIMESLDRHGEYVTSGEYYKSAIFNCVEWPFHEICGKKYGVIGLGAIGSGVAKIARAFGADVSYYSTTGANNNSEFRRAGLDELLETSDIVSIHSPLNGNTKNLITYEKIKLMKKSAILLNLGRGGIINEEGLVRALDEGLISAAGLDVMEKEPLPPDSPLLRLKNRGRIFITPHIAWTSVEARQRLVNEMALNIEAFYRGEKRNQIV